jgi:hypothetical protein
MIPRQIREYSGSECGAVNPAQGQSMRRHLHDACVATCVDHLPKHALHIRCLRRSARGRQLPVADCIGDGAEQPALLTGRLEHSA